MISSGLTPHATAIQGPKHQTTLYHVKELLYAYHAQNLLCLSEEGMHVGSECILRTQSGLDSRGRRHSPIVCTSMPSLAGDQSSATTKVEAARTLHCEGPEHFRHPVFVPRLLQLLISLVLYPTYEPARHASTPNMPSVLHTIRRMTRDDVHPSSTRRAERAVSKRHGWIAPPLPADSPDEHPHDEAYSFFGTPRIASSCRCERCWATPLAQCPATIAATVRDRKVSLPSFLTSRPAARSALDS